MKLRLTALALVIGLMTALAGCVNKQETRNDPVTQPDGQVASTPIPEPAGGGRTGVKTGPFKIDMQAMQSLQEAVNQGHQPWRLDPLQVAMSESQQYGFDPKNDKFELLSKGSGQARVQVIHRGDLYFMTLVQPKGMTIWTIADIQPARQ